MAGAIVCDRCGRENPGDAAFCNGCGAHLAAAAKPADERRLLTVLFSDLADSVRLAAMLDPEDWRDVVRSYNDLARAAIHDNGGTIVQYLGDGVLAYFGYPTSTGDDAANAILAGLALQDAFVPFAAEVRRAHAIDLALRVGIDSGIVVVGATGPGDRPETQAVGDTLNVAARLQGAAPHGTVVMSEATARLVEGRFSTESLGDHELKGIDRPMPVVRALGPARSHRLETVGHHDMAPFVGRAEELADLRTWYEHARAGRGTLVEVRGEPGTGKTRLVRELRELVTASDGSWIGARCRPDEQSTPFAAGVDLLVRVIGLEPAGDHATARAAISGYLAGLDLDEPAMVEPLAELLGLPADATAPRRGATDRRGRILEALRRLVTTIAARRPVVMVVEDVHWADPSTLELLELLAADVRTAPALLVATTRPDHGHPLRGATRTMALGRLVPDDSARLARAVAGDDVADDLIAMVVERGEGLPFFVEELALLARESQAHGGPVDADRIPSTLLASLTTRLDQLGPAKPLAQVASVIGREVPVGLLVRASELDQPMADAAVDQLVGSGLLQWREDGAAGELTFSHALVADAAYQSMVRGRRRELHERVAGLLEEEPGARPEHVARHYESAGIDDRALAHWTTAAERALRVHALGEAHTQLERARACLDRLPASAARDQAEVAVLLLQATWFTMRLGFTDPACGEVLDRALTLSGQGSFPLTLRFQVLLQATTRHAAVSDNVEALRLADESVALVQELRHPMFAMFAASPLAATFLLTGDYPRAVAVCEQGLDGYTPEVAHLSEMGDPHILTLSLLGHATGALGDTATATARLDEAVTEARTVIPPDPHSLGWALYFRAMWSLMVGDLDAARTDTVELRELGDQFSFTELAVVARMIDAAVEIQVGDAREGIEAFEKHAAVVPEFRPFAYLPLQVTRGHVRLGNVEEAHATARAQRDALAARHEWFCIEDYDALLGETVWAMTHDLDAARIEFERGIAEARSRGSRAAERRVRAAYADCLTAAGRTDEAQAMLATSERGV